MQDINDTYSEIYKLNRGKGLEHSLLINFARNITLKKLSGQVNFENLAYCKDLFLKSAWELYAPSLEYCQIIIVPSARYVYLPKLYSGNIYAMNAKTIQIDNPLYNGTIHCNKNTSVIAPDRTNITRNKNIIILRQASYKITGR